MSYSNEDRQHRLDHEMTEAYGKCLSMDYSGALRHLDTAVDNNRQSVYALKFRALLRSKLGRKNEAVEDQMYAALEHTNFARATREQEYSYTDTSRDIFESILRFRIPAFLQSRQSPELTGSMIEVRDEVVIPASVHQLASALPASWPLEQIESTICNQIFHAAATFTPILSWTGVPANEVALTLQLRAAEFGVHGSLGGNNTDVDSNGDAGSTRKTDLLGYVVHRLQVETSPGESWRSDCKLWTVSPGDEHNIHPVQHTGTTGFTAAATVSPIAIPTATIQGNYSGGVTTISPTHGWSKSSRGMTASGNHQQWLSEWKLYSYKDGKKFSLDSCVGPKIPELPFPDPCNVNYSTLYQNFGHEAIWMVPFEEAERLNYMFDFKITVQADVVLIPRLGTWDRLTSLLSPPKPVKNTVSFSKVIHCQFLDSVEKTIMRD